MTQKKLKRSGVFKRRYDRIDFTAPYSLEECQRRLSKIATPEVLPPLQAGEPGIVVQLESLESDRVVFQVERSYFRAYFLRNGYGKQEFVRQTLATITGNLVRINDHETHVDGSIKIMFQTNFLAALLFICPVALILMIRYMPPNQILGAILMMLLIGGGAVGLTWLTSEAKYRQLWELINAAIGPRYHYD